MLKKISPYIHLSLLFLVFLITPLKIFCIEEDKDALYNSRRTAIVTAAEKVSPAVVSVSVLRKEYVRAAPLFRDSFYDFFFPGPLYERTFESLGSGFIVSEDGYILTNQHVVEDADIAKVTLSSGEEYDARVIGISKEVDLAVLKIDSKNLPFATLGNTDSLLIGEWAIAIGNPYGFLLENPEPTVSCGVISGINRNINSQIDERVYRSMIQTDAAINPGNSGGPLVNANGEVIGINTFIFSESGGSIGIGFAIPANTAKNTMQEILKGEGQRVWIGLQVQNLSPLMAFVLDSPISNGVIVASIDKGSPAWDVGFEAGDIIYKISKKDINSIKDFNILKGQLQAGDRIKIHVIRNGKEYMGELIVGKR